ncbi:MAG: hypothetical protein D6800_13345, partial [Candidatus Zixiibacteriota bacterium]
HQITEVEVMRTTSSTTMRRISLLLLLIVSGQLLWLTACSKKKEANKENRSDNDTITRVLLDTGMSYQLPVAATLWSDPSDIKLDDSGKASLIVAPVGTKFRVDDYRAIDGNPWYKVRLTGGPVTGWRRYDQDTLIGPVILGVIAKSNGIPGWFNGKDLEGHILPQLPKETPDTTKVTK